MNVYLDDVRNAPEGFVLVKTVEECKELLLNNKVNILSLDHDLGNDQPTGYDLVKWTIENKVYPNVITVHSLNPVGKKNMTQLLKKNKPNWVKFVEQKSYEPDWMKKSKNYS